MTSALRRVAGFYGSPIFTFLRLRAGSVIAPAILHGTADGTVLLTLALIRGGGDRSTGWGTLSCVAVLVVLDGAIALAVADPRPGPARGFEIPGQVA